MKGPTTVKFIPVTDGDVVEQMGDSDAIHFVGFKPGRAGKREGWLVYLVHEGTAGTRGGWPVRDIQVRIPRTTGVHKRRKAAA